ncbi:LamG domain-containing protein [Erythrobacter phage vB_EliS-L02]|nr:LamG domain-containing protein [Erythrobacter phage vB_EliS-L02]
MIPGIVARRPVDRGGDPFWNNVVLLLSFDNASNRLLDKTGRHSPQIVGAATWVTGRAAGADGGTAWWGANSTANYISVPSSPDFHFGSGDFTVEFWNRRQNSSNNSGFISLYDINNNQRSWAIRRSIADVNALVSFAGTDFTQIDTTILESTNWQHFAFTRKNGVFRIFIGGVVRATANLPGALHPSTDALLIGSYARTVQSRGYIDEVRITKGVCRYDANFTPPEPPYLT